VATPRIAVEGRAVRDQAGAPRGEVDVAHEFEQVGVVLDDDRLEAVLKGMAVTAVAPVELARVAAEDALQEPRQAYRSGAPQGVQVVGQ
jgi:hypothetical protein